MRTVTALNTTPPGTRGEAVRTRLDGLRYLLLLATWGVYPFAFIAPSVISDDATAEVVRQVGYSVADVLAKPLFGLLILSIALLKSGDEVVLNDQNLTRVHHSTGRDQAQPASTSCWTR